MESANISYTRDHLSEILARVQEGETFLITDRQKPVARLEPAVGSFVSDPAWLGGLIRRGLVRASSRSLDVAALCKLPLPSPTDGGDILKALLAEREEGL